MNTDEINRTIAELLGYTCEARAMNADYETYILTPDNTRLEYTVAWYAPQDGSVSWALLFDGDVRIEGFRDNEVVPPLWATDTNAALALFVDMEKLPGFSFRLSYGSNLHGDKWYWHCHVYIADWLACTEKGDTAAEATCKAWIRFKGMSKP